MMAVTRLARLGRLVQTSAWRHPVLTSSCRGARMSAHKLKTENKKFSAEAAEGNKILKSPLCKEILARTRVVTESQEAALVVDRLLAQGQPVAVDCEGVVKDVTAMVQVAEQDGAITLFRTGVNPDLFWGGRLAEVLESPALLKILHASTTDCLSLYKDGVKMWNMFDTCVAFKVLELQQHGKSTHTAHNISFNNICAHFKLPENPLKEKFKNILWKMENSDNNNLLNNEAPLTEEVIFYSAFDVYPLLRLYSNLTSCISSDYRNLVTQLSDIEVIRAVDPDLAKKKRVAVRNMELVTLHLSNLPPGTTPPSLYSALLGHAEGYRHVYTSPKDRTATIVLHSRGEAIHLHRSFHKWASKEMVAAGTQANLVMPELELDVEEENLDTISVVGEGGEELSPVVEGPSCVHLQDPAQLRRITQAVTSTKSPVLVEFSLYPHLPPGARLGLVLYVGMMPSYKISVSDEMIHAGGLGELLDDANCVKIIPRTDTDAVHAAIKHFAVNNISVQNLFDLNNAAKALDYVEHGQSWFQQKQFNSKDLLRSLGIVMDPKVSQSHRLYIAYLEIRHQLPAHIAEIIVSLTQLELTIALQGADGLKAKYKKMELKKQVDQMTMHIRMQGSRNKIGKSAQTKLTDLVEKFSVQEEMGAELVFLGNRCALVKIQKHKHKIPDLMAHMEASMESIGLRYTVSTPWELRTILEKPARKADVKALVQSLQSITYKLEGTGAFSPAKGGTQGHQDPGGGLGLVQNVKTLL